MKNLNSKLVLTIKNILMKKNNLLFAFLFVTGTLLNVNAQENRTLSNGFSIKIVLGVPSNSFGAEEPVDSTMKYGMMGGLQLGNQWYFHPADKYGFGLMVNWFDLSAAAKSAGDEARATIDLSVLEFGPIGTFALSDQMAIDGYYNLRPTILMNIETWSNRYGDYSNTWEGVGLTHAVGAGFRWSVLSAGLEYVFGKVKYDSETFNGVDENKVMKANSFRIILGVKF